MALAEAILVCLTERPMTGYELAKSFDSTIGFFWRAAHQQIYRELQHLRAASLVESKDVVQTGRPNKTIYAINAAGLAHLRAWSRTPTQRPPARDSMLVKLYALEQVDLDALCEEISARLVQHRARLALYERIREKRFSGRINDLRRTGWRLGLDYGLMIERNLATWCESALATLEGHRGQAKGARRQRSPARTA